MVHGSPLRIPVALAAAMLLGVSTSPALAHGHGAAGGGHAFHHPGGLSPAPAPGQGWHNSGRGWNGAPHHFNNGHWVHGTHGGRLGWWWVGAGTTILLAQPVYPWPDAYAPAVTVDPGYAYYCNALQAFYPDVQTCPEPWVLVVPQND